MVHHGVGWGLLVGQQPWVCWCPQGGDARPAGVLVGLLGVLAVLLLHLLASPQLGVFELLHVEVLPLGQQLLPLLLQLCQGQDRRHSRVRRDAFQTRSCQSVGWKKPLIPTPNPNRAVLWMFAAGSGKGS